MGLFNKICILPSCLLSIEFKMDTVWGKNVYQLEDDIKGRICCLNKLPVGTVAN